MPTKSETKNKKMPKQTTCFLSCQWEAGSFELRLLDAETLTTISLIRNNSGITPVFELWKKQKRLSRVFFYLNIIRQGIEKIEQSVKFNLDNVPVLISGSASSPEGITEIICEETFIATDGSNLKVKRIKANENFAHDVFIIAGKYVRHNLSPGQETQIIGSSGENPKRKIIILTGAETKHAFIVDNKVDPIISFATASLFERLTNRSFFYSYPKKGHNVDVKDSLHYFRRGLSASKELNFLQAVSLATTEYLNRPSGDDLQNYLRGLLIGTELKDLINTNASVTLVSNNSVEPLYIFAINFLGIGNDLKTLSPEEAIIRGQLKAYNRFFSRIKTF